MYAFKIIGSRTLAALIAGALITATMAVATSPSGDDLGNGDPGLKVATRGAGSAVIYRDEPQTVGVGLRGGMMSRNIEVIVDQGYGFNKQSMDIPSQLYPLDAVTAYTCSGGSWSSDFKHWDYSRRKTIGYKLVSGQLTVVPDAQKVAAEKYSLGKGEIFLGYIDGRIFYWRDFDPNYIYWRKPPEAKVYAASIPSGVIDLYGATRGIKKDIGFVVFRKSSGPLSYSPYTDDFIEITLADGVGASAP